MGFAIASNSAATLAWWTGMLFTLVSLFCIGYMFCLRRRTETVRGRRDEVTRKWEETLYAVTVGAEGEKLRRGQEPYRLTAEDKKDALRTYIERGRFDPVEPLPAADLPHFLFLWNYLHESLRGNSKEHLNSLAGRLALERRTYRMLRGRALGDKLLAINTFGNLRERAAYGEIARLARHRDPILSLWAWRALLRIDFERTVAEHLELIAARADWSPTFVAKVLLEADRDELAAPLVRLVESCCERGLGERQMARLVSYLNIVHISAYAPLVDRILAASDAPEVLIAALRLVRWDGALARVRELLGSDRWEIRLQAVQTLGRLGHDEDVPRLVDALNDLDWWVRYRAASALVLMPAMGEEKAAALAETLPNEFARDILRQVLAENRMLCFNRTSSSILSK